MNTNNEPVAPQFTLEFTRHSDGRTEASSRTITPGMTLRDYFAGKALQGLLANPDTDSTMVTTIARVAYAQADAMLEERARREEKQ